MAGPTRLELATSGVTGRRSNQLNYDPDKEIQIEDCQDLEFVFGISFLHFSLILNLVGGTGFEPVTPGL